MEAKEFLEKTNPELKNRLEESRVRGEVCEAMDEFFNKKIESVTQEMIIEKAKIVGSKYGVKAELDFGAGAEWVKQQLTK